MASAGPSTGDNSNAIAEAATADRWLFTADRLRNTPSHRDGFDEAKEIRYRQQAAGFIQEMGERLNHHVKDQRGRMYAFTF